MSRTIRYRFAVVFFLLVIITSIVAFCAAWYLFGREGTGSIRDRQRITAEMMLDMAERTDYSVYEILNLCVRDPFSAVITSQSFSGDIYQPSRNATGWSPRGRHITYVRVRDVWVQIFVTPNKPVVVISILGLCAMVGVAIVLGILFAGIISNRMVRPIDDLVEATDKIAKGDFSVRVPIPRDASLRRLVKSFNLMAHDLSGIESLRVGFMNDASHEIRTPLSSIHGFAKLLQKKDLSEKERIEYAGIIAMETERLVTLSSDILNLSKLENQAIITGKAYFSLDEQIRQSILALEPAWSAKNILPQVTLDSISFFGNEELLRRVWVNLIENAIKFTPECGLVSVRMVDAEDAVVVRIKDTGIGMDAETIKHIFKKFYQGDASHTGMGVGLGLPLAKRVVDLCGGEIQVKSVVGQGTTFRVTLPIDTVSK